MPVLTIPNVEVICIIETPCIIVVEFRKGNLIFLENS